MTSLSDCSSYSLVILLKRRRPQLTQEHSQGKSGLNLALEDRYIREHCDEIYALCRLNSLPFNATGEVIENDGVWRVYEFSWRMDAILFWERFEGRWLRGTEFHYPERQRICPH